MNLNSSSCTIGIWDTERGVRRRFLETDLDKVYTFEFIGDDGRLIAGGANGNLEFWDAHTGRRLAEYRGHSDGIYNIVINPTVGLAASASNDATARLWDAQTARRSQSLPHTVDPFGLSPSVQMDV